MLVLFEGPDGGGKSTLAYAVARKVSGTRVACGPPVEGQAWAHWAQIINLANDVTHPIIIDRLHWGDPVYAERYRPETGRQLSDSDVHEMDMMFKDRKGLIVYVTADRDTLVERFDGDYIEVEDIDRMIEEYDRLYDISPAARIKIDTSDGFDDFDRWVDAIIELARLLRRH